MPVTKRVYIKWIVCDVKNDKKKEFSVAQEKWIRTAQAPGFIAQVGGWNLKTSSEACIISFWDRKESLKSFMNVLHDKIFDKNKQADTYNSIVVNHFDGAYWAQRKGMSLPDAIRTGKLLRITDCYIKPIKSIHFENAQKEIWTSEMKNSERVHNGIFSKSTKTNLRYLALSFWDSIKNDNSYTVNMLPNYLENAAINNDIEKMKGRIIKLVDSWKIIK